MRDDALITVVDDDESVRESLPDLLRSFGFKARAFGSAEEFLASNSLQSTQCLVLDVAMPGMSGPDLYDELRRREQHIPVIFITAHGSDALRKRLLTEGAAGFLLKPFDPNALITTLERALEKAD